MNTVPQKPPEDGAGQAELRTRQLWRHSFGEMLIETRADGTVWIDGKVVRDTLPPGSTPSVKATDQL